VKKLTEKHRKPMTSFYANKHVLSSVTMNEYPRDKTFKKNVATKTNQNKYTNKMNIPK
jgi:hypothetical protein